MSHQRHRFLRAGFALRVNTLGDHSVLHVRTSIVIFPHISARLRFVCLCLGTAVACAITKETAATVSIAFLPRSFCIARPVTR
jgi:hypothetical protein